MAAKTITNIEEKHLKKLPDIRPGDTVRVHQVIKEEPKKGKSSAKKEVKERIQVFEGVVIARKHGKGISSTITVRKVISSIGVERIFPLHSPIIEKIEVIKRSKTRRAKLYFLRERQGKKTRLKKKEFKSALVEETQEEAKDDEESETQKEAENESRTEEEAKEEQETNQKQEGEQKQNSAEPKPE